MIIYLLGFPNGKHYVGRTKNSFEQRLAEHKTRATKGHQHPLYYAINKYGWDTIGKEILCTGETNEELVLKELEYILKYDSLVNGYNLTLNTEIGGDNWKGRRNTEQYEKFKENLKAINTGALNTRYGIGHSSESKDKMKAKAKGRFSLPWYIERNGEEEGTRKYNERCLNLKNRNYNKMKDPNTGVFRKN